MKGEHFEWPFFEPAHRALAARIYEWAGRHLGDHKDAGDAESETRALVRALGDAGFLEYAVATGSRSIDVRSLCIVRETLAYHRGLADFAFAMQGLGAGPISLFGSDVQRRIYLPRVSSGTAVAAFAVTEPGAGSDVAAIATRARRDGDDYVIDGEKCWISNGGHADFYVVFARTGEGPGSKGLSAFVVDAGSPGLDATERVAVTVPHPMGTLRFSNCRVPAANRVGEAGRGMAVALATLDVFRSTVGAAATGLARRALDEATLHATTRHQFGAPLSAFQLVQAKLAEMATAIDASALLVYRAAWMKDTGHERVTREAAMAKMFATESAQRVIDDAVQIHGALGVALGSTVEELYREIRPLRIYEGSTDIQKLIIARSLLDSGDSGSRG